MHTQRPSDKTDKKDQHKGWASLNLRFMLTALAAGAAAIVVAYLASGQGSTALSGASQQRPPLSKSLSHTPRDAVDTPTTALNLLPPDSTEPCDERRIIHQKKYVSDATTLKQIFCKDDPCSVFSERPMTLPEKAYPLTSLTFEAIGPFAYPHKLENWKIAGLADLWGGGPCIEDIKPGDETNQPVKFIYNGHIRNDHELNTALGELRINIAGTIRIEAQAAHGDLYDNNALVYLKEGVTLKLRDLPHRAEICLTAQTFASAKASSPDQPDQSVEMST